MDVVCDSSSSSHLETHLVLASRHLALLALFTLVVGDTLVTLRSADVFTMTMHPALVTHIGTRSTFLAWIFGWDRWVDSDGWTGGHEQQRKQLHDQLHHCVQMFVPAGGEWVLLRCEARGRNPWAWAESLANKSITHCEVLDILIFPASGRCARISTQSYQIPDGRGVKFSGWPHLLTTCGSLGLNHPHGRLWIATPRKNADDVCLCACWRNNSIVGWVYYTMHALRTTYGRCTTPLASHEWMAGDVYSWHDLKYCSCTRWLVCVFIRHATRTNKLDLGSPVREQPRSIRRSCYQNSDGSTVVKQMLATSELFEILVANMICASWAIYIYDLHYLHYP